MARWTVSSEGSTRSDLAADCWTEAFELAAPSLLGDLRGMRFCATVHPDGSATLSGEGGEVQLAIRPARTSMYRHGRPQGPAPLLLEECRYSHSAGQELCVPFGVTGELLPLDTVLPLRTSATPEDPPIGFEADLQEACDRFDAMRCDRLAQHAWGALAIWLTFIDVDAVGLSCTDGESETWLARQGSTRGLCGTAAARRIRSLARRTGTSWSVVDVRRERAGLVCPLPDPELGEGAYHSCVLEAWRSGEALRDWQLEVGMLAATVLCDRMHELSEPLRAAG